MRKINPEKPKLPQLSKAQFNQYIHALAKNFERKDGWRNAAIALAGS
jgi:hypothetical protein